jgi:hypothetical protein
MLSLKLEIMQLPANRARSRAGVIGQSKEERVSEWGRFLSDY